MNDEIIFSQSILLIGPSGAGKSTVADELCKITGMQRLCLDYIANQDRKSGFIKRFRNDEEYYLYLIELQLKRAQDLGISGVVDFGAGHSVYDDEEIFERVKTILNKFKNVVLLLPSEDLEESLQLLSKRSTGDYSPNRKFITSPCNGELATIIIYEQGRTPNQIAQDIIYRINNRGAKKR